VHGHGDREREAAVHAGRIGPHRHVHEVLELCEVDDLVVALGQLRASEAGREAAEDHVLAAGELAVEADAEREQRAHAPLDLDAAGGRRQDAGDRPHERRLAGAVGADHAHDLAVRDLERDALERLDLAHHALAPAEAPHRAAEGRGALERRAVRDRHVLDADPDAIRAGQRTHAPGR
jgi:hypothetical protein